jgi:hypothetical protein
MSDRQQVANSNNNSKLLTCSLCCTPSRHYASVRVVVSGIHLVLTHCVRQSFHILTLVLQLGHHTVADNATTPLQTFQVHTCLLPPVQHIGGIHVLACGDCNLACIYTLITSMIYLVNFFHTIHHLCHTFCPFPVSTAFLDHPP